MSDVALQAAILMSYVASLACLDSVKENTLDIWHLNWLWYCLFDNDESEELTVMIYGYIKANNSL